MRIPYDSFTTFLKFFRVRLKKTPRCHSWLPEFFKMYFFLRSYTIVIQRPGFAIEIFIYHRKTLALDCQNKALPLPLSWIKVSANRRPTCSLGGYPRKRKRCKRASVSINKTTSRFGFTGKI